METVTRPLRVVVCGARDFSDAHRLNGVLDDLHARHTIAVVIEGEAPGADALARDWAESRDVPVEKYPADRPGRAASASRNARMLAEGKPDHVVAFPATTLSESPGTLDMVTRAGRAGIPTVVVE
jgi:hypothetical protein